MTKYVGIKSVQAKEMQLNAFNELIGRETVNEENNLNGYLVEYLNSPSEEFKEQGYNHYISWSPKEVFDDSYIKSSMKVKTLKKLAGKFNSASTVDGNLRVLVEDIEDIIEKEDYWFAIDTTTTVCCLTTKDGFTCCGDSASISKEAFSKELGKKYSKEKAVDKLMQHEAYLLKSLHNN